jgi:hypothetical protein
MASMQADPNWTDIVQAIAVAAQLLVLVVAAIVAGRQVGEARRLREEQARPFVVIDFDVRNHLIYIVVSNVGNTLATDVRFEVDPPFESTIEDYQAKELKMFREGISTLAPGKVIETLFDSFIEREPTELPDAYKVTVRYSDERRRRSFAEVIDLDIGLYRNILSVTRRDIHHVNETLGKMLTEMKRWSSTAPRGLVTMSPKERRAESRRQRRLLEENRRRRAGMPPWQRTASRLASWIPSRGP